MATTTTTTSAGLCNDSNGTSLSRCLKGSVFNFHSKMGTPFVLSPNKNSSSRVELICFASVMFFSEQQKFIIGTPCLTRLALHVSRSE
jgi:hypothetical protein